jgi:hypothetical protein
MAKLIVTKTTVAINYGNYGRRHVLFPATVTRLPGQDSD